MRSPDTMVSPILPLSDSTLAMPVKQLVKRPALFVDPAISVAQAAQAMQSARVGSVLISGAPAGIVTDRDLRGRVLAAHLGTETPVSQVMSRPLKTIDAGAPTFVALRLMLEENIHHLPVTEAGEIIGVVSATDLLLHQGKSPLYLRGRIDDLADPSQLTGYAGEISGLAEALYRGGLGAIHISQIVSSLNDALSKRLIALATAQLGPPPTSFAWIVFGSEGRLEQTLLTDQDNALVYGAESDGARAYFAELAKRVVDGLLAAGFPACAGGFMATQWCKGLSRWQELFSQWIRLPQPAALLDAAIFFDFRAVAGDLSLEPLEAIVASAQAQKLFLSHMARTALDFSPPLGFFYRLRSDHGKVDLKRGAIAPIVGLARLAALANGSRERSTLARLDVTNHSAMPLSSADAAALGEIFPSLCQLRLKAQLRQSAANRPIDHNVELAQLSPLERRHLKEALVMIKRVQDALRISWRLDRLA